MDLSQIKLVTEYEIVGIDLEEASVRHLADLGIKIGSFIQVISKTNDTAILLVRAARIALDNSILKKLDVVPKGSSKSSLLLSELAIGDSAYIEAIHADGALKRRLMDMGLTKNTNVQLQKVAPLGDPLEIKLRGYDLTLRKSEASLISVVKGEKEAKQ
ncbi:FeoA family protein [Streptococcus constellatus]|uniref:FeoA family protein n=1 Tax=Streptococcus constellatus TaxID=76860 RepID=UPI00210422A3|nr:FeoA family protein [Streptococcus constellatus]UTX65011.1 ferrous iron transport protein A [Streptococcus constellatus]